MIFINDRKLARRFHENAVSSSQQFWYLLISLGILVLYQCSFIPKPTPSAPWDLYRDILVLTFFLIDTSWCYCINKSGDNKEFTARYMALGVPIVLQTLFMLLVAGIVAGFLLGFFFPHLVATPPDVDAIKKPMGLGLNILGQAYILWRLTSAFKIAAGKGKKKSPASAKKH